MSDCGLITLFGEGWASLFKVTLKNKDVRTSQNKNVYNLYGIWKGIYNEGVYYEIKRNFL